MTLHAVLFELVEQPSQTARMLVGFLRERLRYGDVISFCCISL